MRLVVAAGLILAVSTGQLVTAQDTEPTRAELEAWVADLGAESFSKRAVATKNLIGAGAKAIEPLQQGLSQHGLEVTTRGIHILQQLAVDGDTSSQAAARETLERIAAARVTAAARHARDAIAKLDVLRQQRALDELRQLGAVVQRDYEEISSALGSLFKIEINSSWRGTPDDLKRLQFLQEVEQLTFVGPQIDDASIAHIADMPNIRLIKMKRTSVTDEGLAPLKTLPRLEFVRLLYVKISDDAVVQLARCQTLNRIDLFGTNVTRDGEAKLRDSLAARIDRRRGAFLGIQPSDPNNIDWEIRHVTLGSAADEAGLRTGDVFLTYDTKKVGDFSSLTAMIAEHDAGTVVDVTLRRDGEEIKRTIKLGEWE